MAFSFTLGHRLALLLSLPLLVAQTLPAETKAPTPFPHGIAKTKAPTEKPTTAVPTSFMPTRIPTQQPSYAPGAVSNECTGKTKNKPPVMEVPGRPENARALLIGIPHTDYDETTPYLTDETLTHIANAEVVYGEVPITANNKLAQLQRSHMFMPQGITLKEMIGDSLWMQVEAYIEWIRKQPWVNRQLIDESFLKTVDRFRPGWAASLLEALVVDGNSSGFEASTDQQFLHRAVARGSLGCGLEAIQEQFMSLEGFDQHEEILLLELTLHQLNIHRRLALGPVSSLAMFVCGSARDQALYIDARPLLPDVMNLDNTLGSDTALPSSVDLVEAGKLIEKLMNQLIDGRNRLLARRSLDVLACYPNRSIAIIFGAGHFLSVEGRTPGVRELVSSELQKLPNAVVPADRCPGGALWNLEEKCIHWSDWGPITVSPTDRPTRVPTDLGSFAGDPPPSRTARFSAAPWSGSGQTNAATLASPALVWSCWPFALVLTSRLLQTYHY